MFKKWYQSKTLWVNILTLLAGGLGYFAGHDLIQDHASVMALLVAIQGGVNVALRFVTVKPIG